MIRLLLVLFLFARVAFAQDHTSDFFRDAGLPDQPVRIRVEEIQPVFSFGQKLEANGKITKIPGGYEIVIDKWFYKQYQGKSQMKRLYYYLLAHAVLGKNKSIKNDVMNEDLMYKRLKQRDITKLFKDRANDRR